jgi:hypothetical protein
VWVGINSRVSWVAMWWMQVALLGVLYNMQASAVATRIPESEQPGILASSQLPQLKQHRYMPPSYTMFTCLAHALMLAAVLAVDMNAFECLMAVDNMLCIAEPCYTPKRKPHSRLKPCVAIDRRGEVGRCQQQRHQHVPHHLQS